VSRAIAGRLRLYTQIAGIAAIAWLVWANALARHKILSQMIVAALAYSMLPWAASSLLTFYVYLLVSLEDPREAMRLSIRSSAPGMWFAPAMILLAGVSPTSFVISVLLAVNTARVLVSRWPIRATTGPHFSVRPILSAIQIRTGFVSRKTLPALSAAFVILSGLAAKLWRWPLLSAVFLVAGAAIVTALALLTGAAHPVRAAKAPPSAFAILLTILLSSTLTVGVIQAQRERAAGGASDAPQRAATKLYTAASTKESFPGVVLKTPPKKQPPLSAHFFWSQSKALSTLQSIEFSGEYWMLRPRYDVPPPDALVSDSSPLDFLFRTTDTGPMKMEAHQPLGRPIDLACCASIQIVIDDADHHAGTVGLELILFDDRRSLSLGTRTMESQRRQTLDFPVPVAAALRRFDQLEVIFHRDPVRRDRSANVSIDRFVLIPAQ
jgi:hypothetical protein